jgi:hypothetical protein
MQRFRKSVNKLYANLTICHRLSDPFLWLRNYRSKKANSDINSWGLYNYKTRSGEWSGIGLPSQAKITNKFRWTIPLISQKFYWTLHFRSLTVNIFLSIGSRQTATRSFFLNHIAQSVHYILMILYVPYILCIPNRMHSILYKSQMQQFFTTERLRIATDFQNV